VPPWAWRPADDWAVATSDLPEVLPVLLAVLSGLPDRLATALDLLAAVDALPGLPVLAPRSIQLPSYPRKLRLLSTAARFACWPKRSRVAWSR
jgi:hypothetical protein